MSPPGLYGNNSGNQREGCELINASLYSCKDRLKCFRKPKNQSYRAIVRRIGAVTFFRDRLNVSKLPGRMISRSRETQTKEFDQAVSEFRNTDFENNTKDSIRTLSLPRIKISEGLKNDMVKNFNFRDEEVKGWRSRSNMPSIIQSRVGSKGLSKEFRSRERRERCGAIWSK